MFTLNQISSDAQIKKQIRKIVFGANIFCPACHSRKIHVYESRYRCQKCRCKFSLLSHTWLKNCKLSLSKIYTLLLQTERLCTLSEEAVRHWFRQFRVHLPEFEPIILSGKVQMDEAYFKSLSLLLAKQVGSRKLAHEIIFKDSVDKSEASQFLFQYVKPKTKLQTDGSAIYKKIEQWWPVRHKVDIHKKFEFGLTSEIEGMFGNLRTFIRRMYHHTTKEYLPEYVSEFCFRFSSPEIFNSPLDYLKKTLSLVPLD
jgi:transposase-like protein